MSSALVSYLGYRFRSTFSRRRGSYLALALVIGVLGGTAMASVAAARRTQSSFPAFLASTHPTDVVASLFDITSATGTPSTYSASFADRLGQLPGVTSVHTAVSLNAVPLGPDNAPDASALTRTVAFGSVTGLYFDADRPVVAEGRMPSTATADEFVLSVAAARLLGYEVGRTVPFGFFTNKAVSAPTFGASSVRPLLRVDMLLVGLVDFNTQIVQDDVDRLLPPMLFTPALTRQVVALSPDSTGPTQFGLTLDAGRRGVPAAQRAFLDRIPPGSGTSFRVSSFVQSKVEAALKPASIALAVFGIIAGVAAVLAAALLIGRQLRGDDPALRTLRALGADPAMTTLDGVLGVVASVVGGAALAGALAFVVSPLGPLGPVRPVYPDPGFAWDWTVFGPGLALLVLAPASVALWGGYRAAPHRVAARAQARGSSSTIVRAAANSGLPASAVLGVRFALDPGSGPTAVPVRSALVASVLGVTAVVATLTFGSGLHTLVTTPPLYGWNWDYALSSTNTVPPQATDRLDDEPDVAAWSGYFQTNIQLDGHNVPVLLGEVNAPVAPPRLSGHGVQADNQIALGPATLAELDKKVGDTVVASYNRAQDAPFVIPPTKLKIVGTVTLPAISKPTATQDHLTIGRGAVVSTDLLPRSFQALFVNPEPTLNGPELVLVRLRDGVDDASGLATMSRIARRANQAFAKLPGGGAGNHVVVLDVERPAQIVNYRTMGSAPQLLAGGLALGIFLTLGFITWNSVHRRRRDFAVFKSLGFTGPQLATMVATQASVAAVVGVVFGVPLGIACGRALWTGFARQIYAVPAATVPWVWISLVPLGALLFANLVAALPARSAARTSTAAMLRAE